MRTLKLTLAIAVLTLTPLLVSAQERPKHPNKEQHKNRLKELNLTEEQASQFKAIQESGKVEKKAIQEKMMALKKELKALKTKRKALKAAEMKKVEAILTPEQFIQFQTIQQKRKEHRIENHKKK
jgi:Spy/CpxP family protein refolding chaperone